MQKRSLYQWNAFLKHLSREKRWEEVLFHFRQIVCDEEKPDNFTVPVTLKACAGLREVKYGQMVHGFVKKNGKIGFDLFVGSALIEMYAKCDRMADALRAFYEFEKPDMVMWSSVVSGYQKSGFPAEAVEFFRRMVMVANVGPDKVTLTSLVSSCTQLLSLRLGRCVHGFVTRRGYDRELSVVNSLLNLYATTEALADAVNLFNKMPEKNVVSWSSMIACYVQNQAAAEALCIFNEMMDNGTEPNVVTMLNVLQACGIAGDLEKGRKIHEIANRKGVEVEVKVSTALVDMYMKCFSPNEAHGVFSRMPKKDVVSWVTLLSGFTKNGMAHKSIEAFSKMLLENNTRPDAILMVKVLSSSTELGFLEQAVCLHGYIIRSGFDDNPFVGASIVELYSKCGSLDDAVKVFWEINVKDTVAWSSMISGYGMHGKGAEALQIFDQMVNNSAAKPNHVTFLSVLSACSHTGLIQEGLRIFEMMVSDYKIVPNLEHYAILVDLFGRSGELDKAIEIVEQMPISPGPHVWGALLGACRNHQNVGIAETISKKLFKLESNYAGYYILLSNMYGLEGEWENMAKLRNLVKNRGIKIGFAQSSVEIRREIHRFVVDDKLHPEKEGIYGLLKQLILQMKEDVFPSGEENLSFT